MSAKFPMAAALSPEEVTDFPLFNDVQAEAKKYFLRQTTPDAVEAALVACEELLAKLFSFLHEQMQYQPESLLMVRATSVIYGNFAVLQSEFTAIRHAITQDDEELCLDRMGQSRQCLVQLTEVMAELKKEEDAQPKFCDIPLFNDACRVALMVIQHKLPADALRTRLDQSWELWEQLCQIVHANFEPPPQEGSGPGPLGQALGQIEQGLEMLEDVLQALPTASREAMEDAMDFLGDGSAVLTEHYLALKEPPEPAGPVIHCFRCSAENPPGSTRCSNCNAIFPVNPEASAGTAVNLVESVRNRQWPTFVARLVAQVESFRSRTSTPEEALREITELRRRLSSGLERMGDIEMVEEEGAPTAALEQVGEFFDQLESCVEKALAGLERMIENVGKADPIGVDRDLSDVLVQVERLLDLQRQINGLLDAQAV